MTTHNRNRAVSILTLGMLLFFLVSWIIYVQAGGADITQPAGRLLARGAAGRPRLHVHAAAGAHGTDPERRGKLARDPQRPSSCAFPSGFSASGAGGHGASAISSSAGTNWKNRRSGVKIERYDLRRAVSALVHGRAVHHHGPHRPEPPSGAGGADTALRTRGRFRIPGGVEGAAQLPGAAPPRRDLPGIRRLGSAQHPPGSSIWSGSNDMGGLLGGGPRPHTERSTRARRHGSGSCSSSESAWGSPASCSISPSGARPASPCRSPM